MRMNEFIMCVAITKKKSKLQEFYLNRDREVLIILAEAKSKGVDKFIIVHPFAPLTLSFEHGKPYVKNVYITVSKTLEM